jgi:hypothetical protein
VASEVVREYIFPAYVLVYLYIFAVNGINNLSYLMDFPITVHLTVICSTTFNDLVIITKL